MPNLMKKDNSSLMVLAQAIGGLNLMEPPEIPNDQWWLPRKLTKSKIRDIKDMSEMMAQIYENNTRALTAKLNGAMAMMTASDRLKLEFKKIDTEGKMLDLQLLKEQAGLNKILAETRILENEAKLSDLEIKMRLKAMEDDDDRSDEDR
jgi:hypothetical protein